jgi:hypothetical protein
MDVLLIVAAITGLVLGHTLHLGGTSGAILCLVASAILLLLSHAFPTIPDRAARVLSRHVRAIRQVTPGLRPSRDRTHLRSSVHRREGYAEEQSNRPTS